MYQSEMKLFESEFESISPTILNRARWVFKILFVGIPTYAGGKTRF